jgi:hypothetical protein
MGFIPPGTAVGALAFGIAFLWLATAVGDRLLRWLHVPVSTFSQLERGTVCAAVGAGCLQYVPFALASAGRLSVDAARWTLAAVALLFVPDLWRIGRSAWRQLPGLSGRWRALSRPARVWLATLTILLLFLLFQALTVNSDIDDDGYHLFAPKRWLAAGTLEYLPSYSHTNSALGFEMLYLCGMAVAGVGAAKILHFVAGGLSLLGLFLTGRRLANATAGRCAVSLWLIPTPFYSVASLFGLAFCDLGVCWMTVSTLICWWAWQSRQNDRLLIPAALCAGFAGSFKFTALFVGSALVAIVVMGLRRRGSTWRALVTRTIGCAVLSVGPVLPWLWRNFRLTGNPVYPMFSGVIPTRDWSPEQARIFGTFFRYYTWAVAAGSRLSLGQRKLILCGALVALLVGSAVALRLSKRPVLREILVFGAGLLLAQLALTGLALRFWLPGIMSLGLFLAASLSRRWPQSSVLAWAPAVVLIAAAAFHGKKAARTNLRGDVEQVAGLISFDERSRQDTFWQISRYLNEHTPPGSGVLMAAMFPTFGATSGHALWIDRRCYVTDSHLQRFIKLDDWPSFVESVRGAGIDFVVVSDQLFNAGRHGFSFLAAQNEYPFSRRLAEELGDDVYRSGHLHVYRLRLPARGP